MKSYLFCLSIILGVVLSSAQTKDTLAITYYELSFWEIKDSTKYSPEQKTALKEAMDKKRFHKLITSVDESIYEAIPIIDNSQQEGLKISFSSSVNFNYKNTKDSVYISEESYPTTYIIKDSLINFNWIITKEKKRFLNYEITKAQSFYNGFLIDAWFTNEISYNNGPKNYWGLPGLILIIETSHPKSNQKTQIVADKIEKLSKPQRILPKLRKKKPISQNEFNQILEEFNKRENEMLGIDKD